MYIIIVGGGNVGYYLAKQLDKAKHEVLLLEKDRLRASILQQELHDKVVQGDGCEVAQQLEVGFGRADVVVAVTGSDDDNLVVCQMAKSEHNAARTLARINDPRNEALFKKLGVDATVSSTKIIYNLIEQSVSSNEVIPLAALKNGNLEIVDIEIGNDSPVLDKEITALNLPKGALIISIIRDGQAMIPDGSTRIVSGDSVIALVSADIEDLLRQRFEKGA